MAIDKLVDSSQLTSDLTSVANAIRAKSGNNGLLAFPAGFISEIGSIPTGGGGGDPAVTIFHGSGLSPVSIPSGFSFPSENDINTDNAAQPYVNVVLIFVKGMEYDEMMGVQTGMAIWSTSVLTTHYSVSSNIISLNDAYDSRNVSFILSNNTIAFRDGWVDMTSLRPDANGEWMLLVVDERTS